MKEVYNYIPLCWIDQECLLVCNRKCQLLVHNVKIDSFDLIGELPLPAKEKFLMRMNISARALRLVNFTSCQIGEGKVLVAYRSIAYLVDVTKKEISQLFTIDKGKRPLFFCYVEANSSNTPAGIYYGDYCGNLDKNPINLYYVNPVSFEKKVIYSFDKGMVNHVHNVVYDKGRDCIWIFTGDFGDAAAIWRTGNGFKTVECILKGSQDFRADVVTIYKGDIWYATDAPFAPNYLMRLYENESGWCVEKVSALNGPVIYGGRMGDQLVFSTDVESDGMYKNRIEALTSRKLGKGIKDYYAYLYSLDLKAREIKIIYKCKKDYLPFVIFQFGAIMFPHGACDGRIIPAFHVALNKHQLKTLMIINDGDKN